MNINSSALMPPTIQQNAILSSPPLPTETQLLEQYGQEILKDNKVAFPLGCTNQGNTKTSIKQFIFILDKLVELIKNDHFFNLKIKKLPKQEQLSLKDAKNKVIKELNNCDIKNKQEADKQTVKDAWVMSCIENKNFTSIFTLMKLCPGETIRKSYQLEKGEPWLEDWSDHLLPYFAQILLNVSKEKQNLAIREDPAFLEENNQYHELWNNGVNDEEGSGEYYLFFTYMCNDLYHALPYGTANCALMADFSFLRAIDIIKDSPLKVSYIRFESPDYEEINAIALGSFPDAGSLIVDPWSDRTFIWQGAVQNTAEVASYAECKTIFSNTPGEVRTSLLSTLESTDFLARFSSDTNAAPTSHNISDDRIKSLEEITTLYQHFQHSSNRHSTTPRS